MAIRQPDDEGRPDECPASPLLDRGPYQPKNWRQWLRVLGPGLITGAADDDPSGIGTYAQAGAQFGFGMLWVAFVSLPMMIAVQMLCARIGLVTGEGLAGVLQRHYPRWVVMAAVGALFVANTINVGADLGAIAYGIEVIAGWPRGPVLIAVTVIMIASLVLGHYRHIARVFKWLAASLFAYVITAFLIPLHWGEILHATLVPHPGLSGGRLAMLVALWGTTISPYLFFWQADMEVEERRAQGLAGTAEAPDGLTKRELTCANIDVAAGMLVSNVAMFFIILTTGATLFPAGIHDVQTAEQAATALQPLAGDLAHWLFAAGLISTGALAIPVLAGSSAYAVSEVMGWRWGLDRPYGQARGFYGVLAAGILIGLGLNVFGLNPLKALFWTAVINGIAAPPLLFLIMRVSGDRRIMGDHVAGPVIRCLGWFVTVLMGLLAVALLISPLA